MMEDSLFTKIIKGEVPCEKVYEDDTTLAFLDIYPVQPGHVLVVPKKQVEFLWDLGDSDYQALLATVKKVAKHLRSVLGTKYVGAQVVGDQVPHTHVHLIPFNTIDEYRRQADTSIEPDHEALAAMAKRLAF